MSSNIKIRKVGGLYLRKFKNESEAVAYIRKAMEKYKEKYATATGTKPYVTPFLRELYLQDKVAVQPQQFIRWINESNVIDEKLVGDASRPWGESIARKSVAVNMEIELYNKLVSVGNRSKTVRLALKLLFGYNCPNDVVIYFPDAPVHFFLADKSGVIAARAFRPIAPTTKSLVEALIREHSTTDGIPGIVNFAIKNRYRYMGGT